MHTICKPSSHLLTFSWVDLLFGHHIRRCPKAKNSTRCWTKTRYSRQFDDKSKTVKPKYWVPTSHFVWELSTRFFLQLFSSNSSQDYFDNFIIAAPNLAYFCWNWCNITQILCFTIIYKRVGSFKKELPIHNSLEKRLNESILQLSTPESLGLYPNILTF